MGGDHMVPFDNTKNSELKKNLVPWSLHNRPCLPCRRPKWGLNKSCFLQGNGGETMLVDGFYAAQLLKQRHPDMYKWAGGMFYLSRASVSTKQPALFQSQNSTETLTIWSLFPSIFLKPKALYFHFSVFCLSALRLIKDLGLIKSNRATL
jgi:hypothetical protein